MAHPFRYSLETFKQETELCDVTFQGGHCSDPATCCLLWVLGTRGCSNQGHRAKRMMEVLQAAQHFTSGLEVSAAKPECPRRKKKNHFKRAQRKRETSAVIGHSGQSCVTDWCLQLLVQLRQLRAHPLL